MATLATQTQGNLTLPTYGKLSATQILGNPSRPGPVNYFGSEGDIVVKSFKPLNMIGTPSTGWTAKEYGEMWNRTTVLTAGSGVTLTAAGAAAEGIGKALYSFPVKSIHIDGGSIHAKFLAAVTPAETPAIGVGTTIASGAVSVLTGTAAFHNVVATAGGIALNNVLFQSQSNTGIATIGTGNAQLFLNMASTWDAADTITVLPGSRVIVRWGALDPTEEMQ